MNREAYNNALAKLQERQRTKEKITYLHRQKAKQYPELKVLMDNIALTAQKAVRATFTIKDKETLDNEIKSLSKQNMALQAELREKLKEKGFPEDYTFDKPFCTKCEDRGYIGADMCECLQKMVNEETYKLSKLAVETQTFDAYDLSLCDDMAKKVYGFLKGYAENFSPDSQKLLFMGNPGLGKTFLSSAIARVVIDKGYSVYYESFQDLMSRMEAAHFQGTGETFTFDCDLLILDDLGAEFKTQFTESCLYSIIQRKTPTIISTNLTKEEISKTYHDRICSRLFGEYRIIPFTGKDRRI